MAVLEFVDYVLPNTKSKDELKKERAESKAKAKEAKKAKAAARPAKSPKEKGVKKTGKAGAAISKGSVSRGT